MVGGLECHVCASNQQIAKRARHLALYGVAQLPRPIWKPTLERLTTTGFNLMPDLGPSGSIRRYEMTREVGVGDRVACRRGKTFEILEITTWKRKRDRRRSWHS